MLILTGIGNKYKYAGLEYYGECYCGAFINGSQLPGSDCSFPCTGDSSETCGGNDIISVYQDPTVLVVNKAVISDYPTFAHSQATLVKSTAPRHQSASLHLHT
jgi:hypothetical protein